MSLPLEQSGRCLTTRCVDGVLEVALHAPPLNEIGLPMLIQRGRHTKDQGISFNGPGKIRG